MKKEWLVKTLALGVVVLFISVSFQPVIAVDNKSYTNDTENESDCGCGIISDVQRIRFEKLLNRIEIHTQKLLLIEKYKELSNRISAIAELNLELKSDLLYFENFTICFVLVTIASVYLSRAELNIYLVNIFYHFNISILTDFFLNRAEKFLALIEPIFDNMEKFGCIPS